VKVFSKHSDIDYDVNEMKEKREKMKKETFKKEQSQGSGLEKAINQASIMSNSMPGSNGNTFGNILKKNTNTHLKMPSQISEVLEEETGEKESLRKSQLRSSLPLRGSLTMEDTNAEAFGHKRMQTMEDIGMIINKDSQHMCYDFLTLRKNMAVIKMLEDNWEDVSSYEMFSDNIYLIDESNKKSKKYLFITSIDFYIMI
jgi:hypothetical protein